MSILYPPSHCPRCGAPIPFWRNIPVFTWVSQRGRSACCGTPIAPRYVIIEMLGLVVSLGWAVAFSAGLWQGDWAFALSWYVMAMLAIPLTLIDWEFFIIPDGLNLTLLAAGLLLHAVLIGNHLLGFLIGLRDAALCGGGLYLFGWLLRWVFSKFGLLSRRLLASRKARRHFAFLGRNGYRSFLNGLHRFAPFNEDSELLGMGDVNLVAAGGALFGGWTVLLALPFAAVLGIVGYLVRALLPHSSAAAEAAGVDAHAVPFGPFLCGGMLIAQPLMPVAAAAFFG